MIKNGDLKQGEKIVQEKIAEALGVSRTPLMKALLALESEYLVESIPRKGMYIRSLNFHEIIDIYTCREALEGMAARLLAAKSNNTVITKLKNCFLPFVGQKKIDTLAYADADEKFHSLLITLTGNKPLDNIYFFSRIHDRIVGHGLVRCPEETLEEHFSIIKAIKHGDSNTAETLIRAHIHKSKQLLINQQKNQKSE